MMRKNFLIILIFIYSIVPTFGQDLSKSSDKSPIDMASLDHWPYLDNHPVISNDGNYARYLMVNYPAGGNTLVITGTHNSWKKEFVIKEGRLDAFFSGDSKQLIFSKADSLYLVRLGKGQHKVVTHVSSFKQPKTGNKNWMAYQLSNPKKELVLLNLLNGKEQRFSAVNHYDFNDIGNALLVIKDSSNTLQWLNLSTGITHTIWTTENGGTVTNYNFDSEGKQLVYTVKEKIETKEINTIWYYKEGMIKAKIKVQDQTAGIEPGLSVAGAPQFSKNGNWIFFELVQKTNASDSKAEGVMVDVWSYKDLVLQPEQMRQGDGPKTFAAAIGVKVQQVIRLEQSDESLYVSPDRITGDWVVLMDRSSNYEYWWSLSPQPSYYLMSLKDGSRKLLKKESKSLFNFSFSPNGKYLAYYDAEKEAYFSCNTLTGNIVNITKSIPTKVSSEYIRTIPTDAVAAVAGWGMDDTTLLIYDNYDIWKVDASGNKPPVNITNGYGLANQIKFRLVDGPGKSQDLTSIVFDSKTSLLLTAFNSATKQSGFYRKTMNEIGDPQLLTMGSYTFYRVESQKPHFSGDNGMQPLKAEEANVWMVQRQSATEAPNYFITKDFKTYKPLSNFQPQSKINWLTTELINWKMLNGKMSQGILYKPENFDATKKYPVIFNYYEKLSHRLHEFPRPGFTGGNINIPWFVSNGYLVFTPDIHYEIASKSGKTYDEWAYNSVVSAAQHLSTLPYVNEKKMAIQGHSFGGAETNYIVTHTDIFAAAAEAAGVTDRVSAYLTLVPFISDIEHYSGQSLIEHGHSLTGATLWERPELYLISPVLNAGKVTTPILIMHNKKDNQIPWRQGVEFYMALRRLGKKTWMLQYDNGTHGVLGNDAKDYTIRLTQFFDHYLKDKPAPVWMTEGVPFSKKGIETGYEMDMSGAIP
jgi:dipeptidyl aminopeptidase/acylaminoacyl peptidase